MKTVFTVGHSSRPIGDFLSLLGAHGISSVVDVRHYPGSRRCPQFNSRELEKSLRESGIGYSLVRLLGGFRPALPNSVNSGWRNASFRGYADYMQTRGFADGMAALESLVAGRPAIMCSEAVPWRCHRSMVSDALLVRGYEVLHIMAPSTANAHRLTEFAAVDGTNITYPARAA